MMVLIDKIMNLGTEGHSDLNKIRLIRQVNGLNIFYTIVALSVGLISFVFLREARGTFVLGIIQLLASGLYFSNILITAKKKLSVSRHLTIYTFEWHLFLVTVLTNTWKSPVLLVTVLYPLLAALVEVSIIKHLFVGLFQILLFIILHYIFRELEVKILAFSNLTRTVSDILRIMGLCYFPIMAAAIIKIIFNENLRARKKQKTMMNEITVANRRLEVYAEKMRDESQRLLAEVNIAKKIQSMVLPSREEIEQIKELEIACHMRPADEVGGDYYDIIQLDDTVTISIGDVTGHGLSSGIIMLMAQTAVRTIAELKIEDTRNCIAILNRVLYANISRMHESKNMTLSILSYKNREFFVSGQHESFIICRSSGEIEIHDTIDLGFYVGFLPEIEDHLKTFHFQLEKNDILLLYSDGVTEAVNEDNQTFEIKRICEVLRRRRALSPEKIKFYLVKKLYNFLGHTQIYDDIAFVIIKQK